MLTLKTKFSDMTCFPVTFEIPDTHTHMHAANSDSEKTRRAMCGMRKASMNEMHNRASVMMIWPNAVTPT